MYQIIVKCYESSTTEKNKWKQLTVILFERFALFWGGVVSSPSTKSSCNQENEIDLEFSSLVLIFKIIHYAMNLSIDMRVHEHRYCIKIWVTCPTDWWKLLTHHFIFKISIGELALATYLGLIVNEHYFGLFRHGGRSLRRHL